ncbi:glycoside hydrolase family 68 protein [Micromonospora sediminicola]|uniref:glycoside hydrolase family 68 protein n=1 Tax=Micromonospora sediminicola TaxID=946078 RepID=UPI0037A3809C
MHIKRSARAAAAILAALLLIPSAATAASAAATTPGTVAPQPQALGSSHTQDAYSPYANYTSKWTRADAQQILAQSNPNVAPGQNSLPRRLTMPEIPVDFPIMTDQAGRQVWVWDTWPLTDGRGNQYSYKGWTVIFSLTADPYAGYTFDDRHTHARISYWFHRASDETAPWIYGGHLFADGASPGTAEWSGSTRIFERNRIKTFYTSMRFDPAPTTAKITMSEGRIQADDSGVWFTGFSRHNILLEPDGRWYQTGAQNPFFSFRDPFTFTDPARPGKTFMVFEGNTAGVRGEYQCQQSDLGNSGETPADVTARGANFQLANIGLAVADNRELTRWHFLPPILSANCVNDQTERPQFVIRKVGNRWKYYLFTISHAFTYAAGLRGPDGVYGFVGNGIRSDFQPLNRGGLALGNPTDLNISSTDSRQNPRQFQAYSHYVMPGGLVESFIDNVEGRRGGTLAPTVKMDITGTRTAVDRSVGDGGLLGYGYIPANTDISPPGGFVRR